jgi:hypothetical protein
MRVVDYIMASIQKEYGCTMVNWTKVLGYTIEVKDYDDYSTVSMSWYPVVEAAVRKHITDRGGVLVQPKHPYATNIKSVLGPGIAPDAESPEHSSFLAMQTDARSLLGLLIWVSEAYPQIKYPVNYACAYMHNSSLEVYVAAKHALMYIYANPTAVTWGGANT